MTGPEAAIRWPFGTHWRRPCGDVVDIVGRTDSKLMIEHHGAGDPTWVPMADAADWRQLGEL